MIPRSLNDENHAAIAAFLVEHSGGALDAAHIDDRLRSIIASPAHAAFVGEPLRGAATLVDTCNNLDNAAELALFATDPDAAASLLDWGEALARKGPRAALEIPLWPRFGPAPEMLAGAGYTFSYTMFTMIREGGEAPSVSPMPAGFAWEDLTEERFAEYYQTVRLAFADIPGAFVPDYGLFCERVRSFRVKPRMILAQGRVAAYLRLERQGEVGHVASVGRHPDFRGAGLGEQLMAEALRVLQGAKRLQLEVAARNQRALALYQRFGFCVTDSQDVWLKRF